MRIIFFGSDDFALAHLAKLKESQHQVVACVTQPDRKRDRGMKVSVSPLKEYSGKNSITCLQPEDVKDTSFQDELKKIEADIYVVIAYGRILPQNILSIPQYGAVNVHGSLLPKYRGAAPINWAIINGEANSGLSIIQMNAKMDAGDVLAQREIAIRPDETSETLRKIMMEEGPGLLVDILHDIEQGKADPQPQDEDGVTIASKLNKELGLIDWQKSAQDIHNLVRGLIPWPCAHTLFNGKQLKILKTKVVDGSGNPGEITEVGKNGFCVGTQEKLLLIEEVQLESSKRMHAHDFCNGQNIEAGVKLGN